MSRRTRQIYGIVDLLYGVMLGALVLEALPERHLAVDALGGTAALVLFTAGLALLANAPWAARAARVACTVLVVAGVVLLAGMIGSIGFLYGIYGAVGELGVAVLCVLAALAIPYFVVFPLLQLVHLRAPSPDPRP